MGIISNLSDVSLVTEDVKKLCQDVGTSSSYVWGPINILIMKKERMLRQLFFTSNKFPVSFKITSEESASSDHILYSTVLVILCTVHF